MKEDPVLDQFQKIEDVFTAAVVSNNVQRINECISRDWVLVDAQGGIIPQERFFQFLEQGLLSHTAMTKKILRVKVYGDMALCTGRGQNTGTWQGLPMQADEWITDVYRSENGKWRCVLTHLTPVKNSSLNTRARSLTPAVGGSGRRGSMDMTG
ncbi:MAG: nuclear transport factor 2 family protein [Flavobacteriales bacterium]